MPWTRAKYPEKEAEKKLRSLGGDRKGPSKRQERDTTLPCLLQGHGVSVDFHICFLFVFKAIEPKEAQSVSRWS